MHWTAMLMQDMATRWLSFMTVLSLTPSTVSPTNSSKQRCVHAHHWATYIVKTSRKSSSYPWFLNFCLEAVVDVVNKTSIFIQYSCLIGPLRGYMNWHMTNLDTPSKQRKEGHQFVITWLNLMWLLTHSHNMINHDLHALVHGCGYDDARNWYIFDTD